MTSIASPSTRHLSHQDIIITTPSPPPSPPPLSRPRLLTLPHLPRCSAKGMLHYCAGSNAGMSEASVSEHSEDAPGVLSPGRSQHGSKAQVIPGGLRLYDAQGSCSIVPLEELRQMMQKLRFSR